MFFSFNIIKISNSAILTICIHRGKDTDKELRHIFTGLEMEKKNPLNQKGLSTFLQVVGQQSFPVETIKKKHLIQLVSEVLIITGTISSLFGSSKPLNHSHTVKIVKANN